LQLNELNNPHKQQALNHKQHKILHKTHLCQIIFLKLKVSRKKPKILDGKTIALFLLGSQSSGDLGA
jgi:hypothetical protein